MAQLTSTRVWSELEKNIFAVVGMVTPVGEFITYGVGVSLLDMRHPDRARGRAAVG